MNTTTFIASVLAVLFAYGLILIMFLFFIVCLPLPEKKKDRTIELRKENNNINEIHKDEKEL